jgi:Family of unknown function (DUF5522)
MKQLIEGKDFYYNDEGLVVFTEQYHLEKGYCCGNGCLHCPFNYENVNEAERELLIKAKQAKETSN